MERLTAALLSLGNAVDALGIVILLIGGLKFLVLYTRTEFRRLAGHECLAEMMSARRVLGGYILLALEFMMISDIMASVADPSRDALVYLAAIVTIRTTIGFFLDREMATAGPSS